MMGKKISGRPREILNKELKRKKKLLREWDFLRFDKGETAYDLREKLRSEILQTEKDLNE